MKKLVALLFAFAVLVALPLPAAAAGMVEKLQMPAWLERGGNRIALQAGVDVRAQDAIETGMGGRLHILLADGSVVGLGEKSRLLVSAPPATGEAAAANGTTFELVNGSVRLTAKAQALVEPRTVTVRMRSMAVQAGQADICLQASAEADTLCLISGTVAAQPARGASVLMDQPGTVLRASPDAPPTAVTAADPEMLKRWLAATELPVDEGMTIPGGGWALQLTATRDEHTARALQQKLDQAGFAAELTTTEANAKNVYRLRVTQLDSKAEAAALAARMATELKIAQPWVTTARAGGG